MTEQERIDYLVDQLFDRAKDIFYSNDGKLLMGDPNSLEIVDQLTWMKDLSVLKKNSLMFESYIYDDLIDCFTCLDKAESLDEAWNKSEPYVYDFLNEYLIEGDHLEDYSLEDGSFQDIENYVKDIFTFKDYGIYY